MSNKKMAIRNPKSEDDHYDKIIRRMERDIAKLKAKNKVLNDMLENNEKYLVELSKDKTVQEIFQEVLDNTEINVKDKCPKCGSTGMKKINLGHVKIINCSCGYRNRINEQGSSKT